MRIVPIYGQSYGSNTYLLVSGRSAFIIDPSMSVSEIVNAAKDADACIEGILLTHGHFDHTVTLDELRRSLGVKSYIHKNDAELLTDGKKDGYYSFFRKENRHDPAEALLEDGDLIPLGDETIRVLHTPGHTRGSLCYLCKNILVSGDTLFAEGYGRCDLYGGDMSQMSASLANLRSLDRSVRIYPGHGPSARLHDALDICAYLI